MKTVGIRELKNRLSEFIRFVRSGDAVLVTDRGQVVAELHSTLTPASKSQERFGLQALARAGTITLGGSNDASLYPKCRRLLPTGSTQKLLDEERGGR